MKQTQNLSSLSFICHGFYNAGDSGKSPEPVLMDQVHSVDALFLTERPAGLPKVDALITQTPNLNLTVKTADCAPVLIADPTSRMIAAVHAGWRGAFQGILENTILQMIKKGADLNTLKVGIGPHIQQKSFEMKEDTFSLFPPTEHKFFTPYQDGYLFDFNSYLIYRLKRIGVSSVESILDDTYSDKSYFSYRRNPLDKGRQFSSIMIKGG